MSDFQMAMLLLRAPIKPLMEEAQTAYILDRISRRMKKKAGMQYKRLNPTKRASPQLSEMYRILLAEGYDVWLTPDQIKAKTKFRRLQLAPTTNIAATIKSHIATYETPKVIRKPNPNYRPGHTSKYLYAANPEFAAKFG